MRARKERETIYRALVSETQAAFSLNPYESILAKVLRAARLLGSKFEPARRALRQSELREREAREADRLDRLRNPHDYRGR